MSKVDLTESGDNPGESNATTAADGDVFRGVLRCLIFAVEVVVELGDGLSSFKNSWNRRTLDRRRE